MRRGTLLVVAAVLSGASRAGAQPIALREYAGPATCPQGIAVLDSLSNIDVAALGRVSIRVQSSSKGFEGEIRLAPEPGDAVSREPEWKRIVSGQDCSEVVSALGLMLAIHLDESAKPATTELSAIAAPPTPAPATLAVVVPTADVAAAEGPRDREPVEITMKAAGSLHVRSGLSPSLDLVPAIALGVQRRTAGRRRQYAQLGFGMSMAESSEAVAIGVATWDHAWWTSSAQVCPWAVAAGALVSFEPCVAVHAGRYAATMSDGPEARKWFAFAELTAAAHLDLGGLDARLELGATAPIAPFSVERDGLELFRQEIGWVAGVQVGIETLALQ